MKRLALAVLLAGSAAAADAGALVDVTVRDLDTGRVLTAYSKAGREFVAGAPGHRYAVTLRNNTGERVLAVLSVDGVNAVSGQTASPHQSGYVLDPWQQTEVRGWRKSMHDVAEFVFTSVPDSYAARTGRPENVGVIGVATFREAQPYPPPYTIIDEEPWYGAEAKREGSARDRGAAPPASAPSARAGAAEPNRSAKSYEYDDGLAGRRQDLGTGHGQRRYAPASYTEFERASSRPDEVVAIHYDSWQALVDRGVIPRRRPHWHEPREADPFPVGFVPDPRW